MVDPAAPEKPLLLSALREVLHAHLAALAAMIGASRDEATSAESRPENKYDTRALEASYLAAGQGERLAELKQLVGWIDDVGDAVGPVVRLGSFVQVDDGGREAWLFLAPQGGHTIATPVGDVQLVGTGSPLGRALLGAEAGDIPTFDTPSGERELEILEVL
ncbi:MAG: GreA/GreB family elongation factor [Alphaproteobacteria bacterium]|nr:GreA/GreB family elongation factor [Alphaproteobacteria bacterium]